MPRKERLKRARKYVQSLSAQIAERKAALRYFSSRFPETERSIEEKYIPELTMEDSMTLYGAMMIASIMHFFPRRTGRKPKSHFLDALIFVVREIAERHHISTSLSFTDRAQSKIDTPFAELLTIVWTNLSPRVRSKTASAFIYRARKLRSRKINGEVLFKNVNEVTVNMLEKHLRLPGILNLGFEESQVPMPHLSSPSPIESTRV